jgi:hypothetical protein
VDLNLNLKKIDFFFLNVFSNFSGQKGSSNPSAMLTSLLSRRAKLHEELRNIEKQVFFFFGYNSYYVWFPRKLRKSQLMNAK